MRDVGKIIQFFRKIKKIGQDELAGKLGITKQSLSNIEQNRVTVHTKRLEEICRILEVDETEFWQKVLGLDYDLDAGKIKIMGYVNEKENKHPITWSQERLPVSKEIGSISPFVNLPHTHFYALILADDSMDPFKKDWIVVVDPDGEIVNGDQVVVLYNNRLLLRTINITDSNSFSLTALRSFEEPMAVLKKDAKILHKAWCFVVK
ncbi:MAG: LexA family transcriptional regulator [Deltaproteobacteria bacterium]|nr:LexA family transcriptional regulator [Deltaproteobacteria bacterium]